MRGFFVRSAFRWSAALLVLLGGCGRRVPVDVFEFLDGDLSRLPEYTDAESVLFSSYDRTGGNDDGFSGLFSRVRLDDRGEHVLAEMDGPGCVKRIWMTWPGRSTRIRIYVDEADAPAVDLPIEEFFSGETAPLLAPFVDGACRFQGVLFSYAPIPFAKKIRITTADGIRFYQVQAHRYPRGARVESFTFPPGSEYSARIARARAALLALPGSAKIDAPWTVPPGEGDRSLAKTIRLPEGCPVPAVAPFFETDEPGVIRELRVSLEGDPGAWGSVLLRCEWDGAAPAVDVPLGALFGSGFRPVEFRSAAILASGSGGVIRLPMPFRTARLFLVSEASRPVTAAVRLLVGRDDDPERRPRLHVMLAESGLEAPRKTVVRATGRGHYVGTLLSVRGTRDASVLEGDDRMIVDGDQARTLRGTGTEDYFNAGWYFAGGLSSFPFHGATFVDAAGAPRFSAFRLQLSDRVAFHDSLLFDFELGDGTEGGTPGPGGVHQTVALWYQEEGDPEGGADLRAPRAGWIPRGVVLPMHLEPLRPREESPAPEGPGRWGDFFPGWDGPGRPLFLSSGVRVPGEAPRPLGDLHRSPFPENASARLAEGLYDVSIAYARGPGLGILHASWGGIALLDGASCAADSVEPVVLSPPRRIAWNGEPMPLELRVEPQPGRGGKNRAPGRDGTARAVVAGVLLKPAEPPIDRWLVTGPFDDFASAKFDTVFGPEREHLAGGVRRDNRYPALDGREAGWAEARADSVGFVNLREAVGGGTHRIAYAAAWVWSPRPRPALFSFGTDDGGKVWLNGRLLWRNPRHRPWRDDEDRFTGELHEGWNEILVKVDQVISGWGFSLRVSDARGELIRSTDSGPH